MEPYYDSARLYFSRLAGGGIYTLREAGAASPLPDGTPRRQVPLFENLLTRETFFPRTFRMPEGGEREYLVRILYPCAGFAAWPVDLIPLTAVPGGAEALYRTYSDTPQAGRGHDFALLFPYDPAARNGGYPALETLGDRLKRIGQPSYEDAGVRAVAAGVAAAFAAMDQTPYRYYDVSLSRIFIGKGERVLLDYSPLMARGGAAPFETGEGCLPLEFIEPRLFLTARRRPDARALRVSLAALLFFLLFGRLPYAGQRLIGWEDAEDAFLHYDYLINHYLQAANIDFIFDPAPGNPNRLTSSLTDQFRDTIALWEEAPEALRRLFVRALSRGTALRLEGAGEPPSAGDWQACFESMGWTEHEQ